MSDGTPFATRSTDRRPNLLYFVCHDLGRHLGAYGALVESPHLDAFARDGVTFRQAFCSSPACSPSRACAMTGRYAHTTGAIGLSHMGWPLAPGERTVVDHLNDAGYETILSGLLHERHPKTNRYQVDLPQHWHDARAERAVDQAVAYLETRDRGRPFYLNIGTQQVHESAWDLPIYGDPVPPEDVYVPNYLPDSPLLRARFGRFQAAIRYLDHHFGRLMAELGRLGHLDDTLVVFTTDHGISAHRAKSTLYDRGTEIALFARLPGGAGGGRVVDHLIPNIDFAPTLLEAAGVPIPGAIQGHSFWPLLAGGEYTPNDAIFLERNFHGQFADRTFTAYDDRYDPVRAVRTPEFHYIRWFDPGANEESWLPWELPPDFSPPPDGKLPAAWPPNPRPRAAEALYHLPHDPGEFCNVAQRPEYRHVRARMAALLQAWMEETDDFALTGRVPERPEPPGWGAWEGLK